MISIDEQSNKCIICGSDNLKKFKAKASDVETPHLISIIECPYCVFAWQYPLSRSEVQSIEFFDYAYANKGNKVSQYFNPNHMRKTSESQYGFISSLPVADKTLLDIGAGAGVFANVAAQNGYSVTAIDPALDVNNITSKSIRAIRDTTDQLNDNELFDVITMWDVIEHSTDPREFLLSAKKHLKKGGYLVLETGNYKSSSRVNGGTNHWIYQQDHRWYFSPETLIELLKSIGLNKFMLHDKVLRPAWNGSHKYYGPKLSRLIKKTIKDPIHVKDHMSKHITLNVAKSWEAPGLSIFTVAARFN